MVTPRAIEPCPRCNAVDAVRCKLLLVNPGSAERTGTDQPWRPGCACEGDLAVDSLKPEFISAGALSHFVAALYCDRCGIGYIPEYMAKPAAPRYQGSREGFRRVRPDGSLGPLLKRIADDPDANAT
jgi:hypothetical protein